MKKKISGSRCTEPYTHTYTINYIFSAHTVFSHCLSVNLRWLFRTHAIAKAKKEMDKEIILIKKNAPQKATALFFQSRPVLSCPIAGFKPVSSCLS